ncbi:MAG: GNAT family N-acetyltransferase [Eubacteriales bacterium]|nr:GNAT family N-acetyltransferase [Eubacteriales bacterium]
MRENSYEVGYCFLSDYHGMGYAKESHIALFNYLRTLGITKFTAGTGIGNMPSVALLKSLGFELIGKESVSFYKDAQGNDIVFEGGIFKLNTVQ